MKPKAIAIIGLGLMGGSLAAACRKKFPHTKIIGISRNRSALSLALRKKWIHAGTTEFAKGVHEAGFVVLCTPVDTFAHYLQKLDACAKPETLVTDVGSVKESILRSLAKKRFKNISYVSAHPMVGSHERGMPAALPDLYNEGYAFLIRESRVDRRKYDAVKNFWKKICPRIIEVTAREHDQIVGDISHLPHVVATCLVLAVREKSLGFAASGFRDATRIAQGHLSIWKPIFEANRKSILMSLSRFEKQLKHFRMACQRGRGRELSRMLAKAVLKRSQI